MKTIFLQPPDPLGGKVLRDMAGRFGIRVSNDARVVLPPLDFAYAASVLEKSGYFSKIIDAPAQGLGVQGVLDEISMEKPDVTVINTTPVSLKNDFEISNMIKEGASETWVCLAGSLVSILPEIALNGSKVDIVIRNEIEGTILDLLKALEDRRFEDVKGIAYRKNGEILKTPERQLITNLDELPFPAFHLLPVDQYCHNWFSEKDKPFLTMLTSRGCSYRCIYCPYPIGYGDHWRGRSAPNVLDEISFLVDKFHVRNILFRDQVFTFDMKRTEEICRGIVEKGIDVRWRCETRVDRLSKRLMTMMRDAGCAGIHLGVESGDPEVLSRIGKPGLNTDMIKTVFADAEELGIETGAFFMVGLPGETRRSIWKSFELAMEINPNIISIAVVTPYPGTELYRLAEEKGWILNRDWASYTGFDVVMRTNELSEEDILQAVKYFSMCVRQRRKKLEKEVFSRKGFQKALLKPLTATRWLLRMTKNRFANPQEKFRKWALER